MVIPSGQEILRQTLRQADFLGTEWEFAVLSENMVARVGVEPATPAFSVLDYAVF